MTANPGSLNLGKATFLTLGALLGGGSAFYWRETYTVKRLAKEASDFEVQLKELRQNRREKEESLTREKQIFKSSTTDSKYAPVDHNCSRST